MLSRRINNWDGIKLILSDERLVEEVGSANIFMRKGNQLVTPKLSGSILPGVTRKSIIQLAQDQLGLNVEEGDLLLKDIFILIKNMNQSLILIMMYIYQTMLNHFLRLMD